MTELVSLTPQLQTANWGWTIAMFLWLVGLSGMGFFLNFWIRQKNFVYVLTVSGILGTLLVASHLARMLNLPIALFSALSAGSFNTQSWMLIGIVLLSVLCIGAVFYSLICAGILFKGEMWQKMAKSSWFNFIFAALGVLCTIYSGFLLTQAVGIPFWNTALIPLLWIMSGLASAIGCIELLMVFKLINPNTVGWSRRTALWVEIAELFTIFAFLHVALGSVLTGARVGAESLISGPQLTMFWFGVIICGCVTPLLLNLVTKNHKVLACGAVLGIMGALFLRASVLFAGYYDPIVF
ncbi:NrfD/PsrC family molybdoenzyme membrane anchor subunit [Turicimonas muris]|uniref:NrfD/PsrC family molybdoenzyme membrane anchor subunit n=1 Tax=Turicimonas muris TaxID=1796652 RepID=UPI0024944ACB|nr:NrfD/PsrC family molybdoenzyme membrane anchor subunit [Turicimonas muris]